MTTTLWTPLNVDLLRPETKADSGERTKAAIYDVPVAFAVDQQDGLAKLQFKYVITDEPTEEVSIENAIVTVGKHSRRLYGLSVTTQAKESELWETLRKGLDTVLTQTKDRKQYDDRRENFGIAKRVVRDHVGVVARAISLLV